MSTMTFCPLCGIKSSSPKDGSYARELCRAAPARGESNGKLVGWWNGITPGFDGMGMPSIRWGADAEDSRHDIPLYDGYNPIHYVTPVSAPAGSGEVEALVQKWRDRAAREDEDGNPYETQQSEMRLRLCADELEALLRKLQQGDKT